MMNFNSENLFIKEKILIINDSWIIEAKILLSTFWLNVLKNPKVSYLKHLDYIKCGFMYLFTNKDYELSALLILKSKFLKV